MAKKLKCFAWTILKSFVPSHRWIVVHLCEPCEPLMAFCYIFDAKTGWHVNEGTFASLFNSIYLRSCGTRRLVDWLIWSPMTASTIALDQFFPCPWGPGGWLWGWRGLQVTVSFSVSWWPQLASSPLWISFDCVFACKRPTSNPPREFATNRCNLAECVFCAERVGVTDFGLFFFADALPAVGNVMTEKPGPDVRRLEGGVASLLGPAWNCCRMMIWTGVPNMHKPRRSWSLESQHHLEACRLPSPHATTCLPTWHVIENAWIWGYIYVYTVYINYIYAI